MTSAGSVGGGRVVVVVQWQTDVSGTLDVCQMVMHTTIVMMTTAATDWVDIANVS